MTVLFHFQHRLLYRQGWPQPSRRHLYSLIAILGLVILITTTTRLSISATPSLPYHYYLTLKSWPARRGDLVAINGHATCYHPQPLLYVKRLVGLPGDTISIENGVMWVAGYPIKPLRTHTLTGQPLTALTTKVVPEGQVLVVGEHAHSFDSRYQEFGLVGIKHIQGKTWGWGRWQ